MAPKKLSDSDRKDILTLYRQPEETTVTIANQYGVSTSTISRILKQHLSEQEYESLIQQKRSGGQKTQPDQVELPGVELETAPPVSLTEEVKPKEQPSRRTESPAPPKLVDRQRKPLTLDMSTEIAEASQLELATAADPVAYPITPKILKDVETALNEDLDEDGLDDEDELDDEDLDDDLDDLDDEEEDEEDEEDEDELDLADGGTPFAAVQVQGNERLRVLPLSEASMPKTCYVVVDRSSELITRPLRDFAELGQIPEEEIQAKTLPIFDNHRVAKRFMRRMQRVVKVPDSRIFQKVKPYLEAKGITRLLIDGRVYSL